MQDPKVDFRPLLLIANLLLVGCIAFFGYLIVGDSMDDVLAPAPQLVERSTPRGGIDEDYNQVVNGVHVQTGLIYAEGFEIVRGTCTACHSAQLVTQNRATRDGWLQMIRWMQATQGLWDLGKNERPILDYLAAHYAPEEVGRRANLDVAAIEWYILELED